MDRVSVVSGLGGVDEAGGTGGTIIIIILI